ncbi:MAG: SRPBCC family protein [Acidobacteriota bacterium]
MLLIILLVIVLVIAVILVIAATKPAVFRVERRASIMAPPEKIFPLINDFHNWPAWSPWEKLDPDMKRTFSGSASGPGAAYAWEGNSKAGAGRMEITEAIPSSKILIKLDFLKPFEAHNTIEYTLERQGSATNVNWAMYGPSPFVSKVMQVFMSMDRMIGKDFEAGLSNMKAAAEK